MRDLKKTAFVLNVGALLIAYAEFFEPLAKVAVKGRYEKIEAGRIKLQKINKTSEETQKVIDKVEPEINNGMHDEHVNSIYEHMTSISNLNQNQQMLSIKAKTLITDNAGVATNDPMLGTITNDDRVKEALSIVDEMKENSDQIDAHKEEILDLLSKIKGSGSSNFTESITQLILEFQDLINSVSLNQLLTIINILTGVLILNCLLTLIAVFYGESLISYFNIEQKFPRLTKFIKLRSKFQQFYFFVNSIIIIIALVIMIYANYLMFIYP